MSKEQASEFLKKVSTDKAAFYCHSSEGWNPEGRMRSLDSGFHRNGKIG